MRLKEITDKGASGKMYSTISEIFFNSYEDGQLNLFAFDQSKKIRQINIDYFGNNVIGKHYKKINEQLSFDIQEYAITKGNKEIFFFSHFQEDCIFGFDSFGNKVFEWLVEIGDGHAIYDIKFQEPNFLWLSFPTGQTISQVSIEEKQEVFRIGNYSYEESEHEILSFPESTFIIENFLYVPNMGNGKLLQVNLDTKDINLVSKFDEHIWQYVETNFGKFISTSKGIYELEN